MSKSIASNQLNQARARRAVRLQKTFQKPTRAKQSFSAECDINNIMRKFEKTGVIEHVKEHGGRYGDFLAAPQDYHAACNQVATAQEMFESLPSKVRKAFDNDPGEFLATVDAAENDPTARQKLEKLGILKTTAQPSGPGPENVPAGTNQGAAGEPGSRPEGGKTSPPEKASQEAKKPA